MYHFFVKPDAIESDVITISGEDVNHIKNVLRLKCGERIIISCPALNDEKDYYCSINEILSDSVRTHIDWTEEGRELNNRIYLFQCLPKNDKMELIIQKAVELGVYEIIPVAARRSVVKLDDKKEAAKLKRWQAISESAAKQSKRSIIPAIRRVMSFEEALGYAKETDVRMMPYENAEGIGYTRKVIAGIEKDQSVSILVGPEGGFEPSEVLLASDAGYKPVTLGKRILRTETAGMMMLSVLMFNLED